MSLETFGTMSRVIRFDNKSTRQKRRKLDKLAAVQEDLAVVNYIAKKKNVIRMSNLHRGKEVSNITDKYPLVILDYNSTKWDTPIIYSKKGYFLKSGGIDPNAAYVQYLRTEQWVKKMFS
ncbi:hypothetical protein TNCT_219601 [Trichonephila clavata]|uniref:Uncharacterized protein n=1 Tax=Trichonephila clavata TaxID=2740835 RepID=A0A8X6I8J3_TRICU|nr:hypothetical protein TNCT_219601 [Trichonephila clavata]